MDQEAVDRIAATLLNARVTRRRAPATAFERMPDTGPETGIAYAVQDAVIRQIGACGGWKVGAASPKAEPLCAPLPRSLILESPARFPPDAFGALGLEAEVAFRLDRDLPPRDRDYERGDVEAAIAAVLPVVEVVDSRWEGWPEIPPLLHLSDFQSNGALVTGPETTDWRTIDLLHQPVTLGVDGNTLVDHVGGNKAGDMLRLVTWLANHAARRCGGLRQGQIVTTGSCTGLEFATPGASVVARFRDLGSVEIQFAAEAS